jgi:DNA-binding NarL/FixJ family response regulator
MIWSGKMGQIGIPEPVRIGLVVGEPIRMEGLTSVFEEIPGDGHAHLLPVLGSMEELLSSAELGYLVVDLNSAPTGLRTLEEIRRQRPDLRLIVIGPAGSDELVMDSVITGARAYLDSTAGPQVVRQAIEVVINGSIWAPRRLLSKLIDRLLKTSDASLTTVSPHLTERELQVLELLLMAQSNREIARQLGIEERTVKAHVGRLMRKTGADNRIELSLRALNQSLVPGAATGEHRKEKGLSLPEFQV